MLLQFSNGPTFPLNFQHQRPPRKVVAVAGRPICAVVQHQHHQQRTALRLPKEVEMAAPVLTPLRYAQVSVDNLLTAVHLEVDDHLARTQQ